MALRVAAYWLVLTRAYAHTRLLRWEGPERGAPPGLRRIPACNFELKPKYFSFWLKFFEPAEKFQLPVLKHLKLRQNSNECDSVRLQLSAAVDRLVASWLAVAGGERSLNQ